jgi:glucokinase
MSRVLGLDIGGSSSKIVLLGADDEVIREQAFSTQDLRGPAAFQERLAEKLEPWLRESDAPVAAGVAVAGLLSSEGILEDAPNLPAFRGWHVADELSLCLRGMGVVAENDVNAMAYAELHAGAARDARHVILLALGTGVGGALIIDRELYRGTRGVAGELGHMTLQVDGPECSCGEPGHVEAYLGAKGIAVLAGSRLDAADDAGKEALLGACRAEGELSTRAIARAAEQGDPLSRAILADVGRLLGLVCASYVNIFNPDVVVIGGGVALCGEALLGPARKSMKERAMPAAQKGVRMVTAELGLHAAAIGAALLARRAHSESGEMGS